MKSVAPTLTLLLVLAPPVSATAWNIYPDGSGDAPTIQAGIDSSATGDTVLVHPGTYNESIDFLGKDIVVKSLAGPELTIIDASSLDSRTVHFSMGETRAAILEGLMITGGRIGVFIAGSEPTVRAKDMRAA